MIVVEIAKLIEPGPELVTMGKLPQTLRAKKVVEYAMEEARELCHNYVDSEHLLLGLLREGEGLAAQVLNNLGLTLERAREEVRKIGEQSLGKEAQDMLRRLCDVVGTDDVMTALRVAVPVIQSFMAVNRALEAILKQGKPDEGVSE